MFASIRRYVAHLSTTDELAQRVDHGFADLISAQPGFLSYEFLDCGGGEVITVSVFTTARQAEESRELARRWTDESLQDFEFTLTEALHGEILVRRATDGLLTPAHPDSASGLTAVRRYKVASDSIRDVMALADRTLAGQIAQLSGFVHYCAIDCGDGNAVSISRFRERTGAEMSDTLARQFVREQLSAVEIERTEWVGGGPVLVSRAAVTALQTQSSDVLT
jgi:hypothetical protein